MKSPLIGRMKTKAIAQGNIVKLPSMTLKLKGARLSTIETLNLTRLKHINNNLSEPKPKMDRGSDINKIAHYFHKLNDKNKGHIVLCHYQFLLHLFNSCEPGIYPFSQAGLIALSRYLWVKIQTFDPLKKLWDYADGEPIGLKESTANQILNSNIKLVKEALGKKDSEFWLKKEKPFSATGGKESFTAYDDKELKVIVRRLTLYFTQLATSLIEFKRTGENEESIRVSVDGADWLVPVTVSACEEMGLSPGVGREITSVLTSRAFNQAMVSGYYLLSYFTAFNTSTLFDVRRPLKVTVSKTEEWYLLEAYKGRSSSNVEALLGGKTHKKALTFIKLLISLSETYETDTHGLLVHMLTNDNTTVAIKTSHLIHSNIGEELDLNVTKKHQCVDYLCRQYAKLIQSYQAQEYVCQVYRVKDNCMKIIEKRSVTGVANRLSALAFAIIDSVNLESVLLTGVVLPIGIEENGETVKLSFQYINGKLGNMTIPLKYFWVVERQLEFAISRSLCVPARFKPDYTKMQKRRRNYFESPLNSYNPMYFIPYGSRGTTGFTQWSGLSPKMHRVLADLAVRLGDFRLNLNSSRLRETNAKLVRARKGNTVNDVATILQNMTDTVLKNYGEDNKEQNLVIMSQGLQIIQEIVIDTDNEAGMTKKNIERAKKLVRDKLNVPVLEYDQYLQLARKSNGIGMHCGSPNDPDKTRKATREAEQAGILKKGEVLACHEYMDCIECEHSKLINDVHALYRLMSFINLLEEFRVIHLSEEHYQLNFGSIVTFFNELISAKLSKEIIKKAKLKLQKYGRHKAWNDLTLVKQFLV